MEHDFTRGNILKTIPVFALPYMLSYFLQMLYGMADLYMMGQFSGAAGITAVGNGAQTLYIITVTLVGLAMGTTVIVGHAVGSRRFDRAEAAIGNTITLLPPSFAAPCCTNASTLPTPMRWSGKYVNCRRASTRPLSFWAIWAWDQRRAPGRR